MAVIAIHPGEHLAEELEALEISAAELARKIRVPTNRVTQILNGSRSVTGDTALRLGHFLERVRSFGSICRVCTNCVAHKKRLGSPSRCCPR